MRGAPIWSQLVRKSQEHQLIKQWTRARHTRCIRMPILIALQHFIKRIQRELREFLRSNQTNQKVQLMSIIDSNAPYAALDPYNEMQDEALAFAALHRQRTRLKQILYLTKILPLSIACVHVAAFSIIKHSNSRRRRSSYYKFMSSSFFFIQMQRISLQSSSGKAKEKALGRYIHYRHV